MYFYLFMYMCTCFYMFVYMDLFCSGYKLRKYRCSKEGSWRCCTARKMYDIERLLQAMKIVWLIENLTWAVVFCHFFPGRLFSTCPWLQELIPGRLFVTMKCCSRSPLLLALSCSSFGRVVSIISYNINFGGCLVYSVEPFRVDYLLRLSL